MINSLRLKNDWLVPGNQQPLLIRLIDRPMHGKDARLRNQFVLLIDPLVAAYNKNRQDILLKHATKKEDGTEDKEANGNYKFTPEAQLLAVEELNELVRDYVTIDILPSNQACLKFVQRLLDETTYAMNTNEGIAYDQIMNEFEAAFNPSDAVEPAPEVATFEEKQTLKFNPKKDGA